MHSVPKQTYYLMVVRIKKDKNSYFGIGWSLSVREFSLLWVLPQHSVSLTHLAANIPGFDLTSPAVWLFAFASAPSYPTCQKLRTFLFKKNPEGCKIHARKTFSVTGELTAVPLMTQGPRTCNFSWETDHKPSKWERTLSFALPIKWDG